MILERLLGPPLERRATKQTLGHPRDPVLARWFGSGDSVSGVDVNEDTAFNYSVVWAATRLLVGSIGMLPLKLYRNTEGGGKEEAKDHPLYRILHDEPNPEMSSMAFRSSRSHFQINWGNGYAEIERDTTGRVRHLWPIHASRVRAYRSPDKKLWYEVRGNSGNPSYLPAADVLNLHSFMTEDGVCGKGVIAFARESIGHGMAIERHGSAFFGNGARPGLILSHPRTLSDQARQNMRREWNEMHQGAENTHKLAILQEGVTATPFSISNEDSQFLESRQFSVEEMCRWYGVPPHMVQHLNRATFNNIEHMGLEFVVWYLMPWLDVWEQEIQRKLLDESERDIYFAKHNVDALLRGDSAGRAAALQIQFQNGALNIDEWRSIENRNPLEGGAGRQHFVPLNMVPVQMAAAAAEANIKNAERPEQAPPAEPVDEPDDEPPPEDEERSLVRTGTLVSAHREILEQVLGRLVRKEAAAARRAANKPEVFLSWIDEFYGEHEPHFGVEVTPALRAVCSLLRPQLPATDEAKRLAKQHSEKARSELLEASGVSPDKFKDAIEQWAAEQESRAPSLVDCEISYLTGG